MGCYRTQGKGQCVCMCGAGGKEGCKEEVWGRQRRVSGREGGGQLTHYTWGTHPVCYEWHTTLCYTTTHSASAASGT
jgi:hypothetical protein